MQQLIQNFKSGELYVDEVPLPSLSERMVLVENRFSLISPGTEKGTVITAQASLFGKAKQRPDLVAQVLQNVRKEGLKATLEKVKTKLDSLKALGYSTSGVVIASMDSNGAFKPGDRVACAGQDYASHAEIVSVPQNLVAKIPDNVTFEEASFATLGAIALQGVRQADPKLGDNVCVIGLGLIGQLTCQILKANGCNVFGIDISLSLVDLASRNSAHVAVSRYNDNLQAAVDNFTGGNGFDTAIITAATPTNDPVVLSSEILRKKGKVVLVGAIKMDIPRDPHFYRKELDLRMSCSYGPGRYDGNYEEGGNDYPYAYVRWSEQRNLEAFLKLLANRVIDVTPLITHVFDIENAEKAYDLVLGKEKEFFIGILLRYCESKQKNVAKYTINMNPIKDINVGFVGAGSFAQSYLIPYVKTHDCLLDTVITTSGLNAKNTAFKFGFNHASTTSDDVFCSKRINTVFIATRHNSHSRYVIQGLKAGKNVFVEKPLAINIEELADIINVYQESDNPRLMVGFNRRFAPLSVRAKEEFRKIGEPLVMNFRINAGFIPREHWTQNENIGGGRIIGEICHFIDLMQYFTAADPVRVYAECIDTANDSIKNDDNMVVVIKFSDGSVGNLTYLANGDKALPKENIEIFGGKKIFVINDFKEGLIYKNNKNSSIKMVGKGHKEEVTAFLGSIRGGSPVPISFESICLTTLTTFRIIDSLRTALPQKVELYAR
ncbi:MAG: oxidoreductase [Candidatus Margulisiibacteriota bacterium]|nr:MAG: oxidoreductase [Candidatus Margulisbacteria bacterium GWD2_39_127]OGI04788.1 MAG: oxidoreductase [Candidatus Margulisbacteria bacterium GWF2_38_17]OGI05733.1 MAG: oxidoreductase [Candidatus Margulisbacteria bacterium GWE2_39_32]PZM83668.1 MAG: oxidoreductase [Candidatus Margulisiibacteriota bacterium]HAR62086.1 oxidoreductase [Candidatus Margulisiibacteriota bacterium]